MALWCVLTFMTAIALTAILWPFSSSGNVIPGGSDIEVYKDQLAEIDRDQKDGLTGAADAEATRVEVSRRLILAAQAPDNNPPPSATGRRAEFRRFATLAIAIASLPLLTASLYLQLGSPGATSTRNAVETQTASVDDAAIDDMVSEVESYLKESPNDGHGWEALAPVYMRLGRYDEAIRAWQNAIANLGEDAEREENLGEAYVAANDGAVTKEAKRAFEKALLIDPHDVAARFYTGLAAKQEGRRDDAAKIWRDLIGTASPEAEWIDTVRNALARLDDSSIAAAGDAPPSEQQPAMIQSMVAGLAARLKADGRDPDSWLRLVRSYIVLGERDSADSAVADARAALANDPGKLTQFEDGLKSSDLPQSQGAQQDSGRRVSTGDASPEHDNATMHAMVDRLAERLKNNGGDAESWLMLVRSYQALGERDRAAAAIAQARLALASDPERLSQFDRSLAPIAAASAPPSVPRSEAEKPAIAETNLTEQQMTMIQGMVDRLAERLGQDGTDRDGWMRLMRSYVVLGQRDRAIAAGQRARLALSSDADALRRIDEAANELGLSLPPN
jgi:cytochrome c-type biogenesis protein CcmH